MDIDMFLEGLQSTLVIAWLVGLVGSGIASAIAVCCFHGLAEIYQIILYAWAVAVATSIGVSFGKMLTLPISTAFFCWCAMGYGMCGLGSLGGGAIAATKVDQSIYLPLNECMKLAINAITGYMMWCDEPVMPIPYILLYVQMCLAVALGSSEDTSTKVVENECISGGVEILAQSRPDAVQQVDAMVGACKEIIRRAPGIDMRVKEGCTCQYPLGGAGEGNTVQVRCIVIKSRAAE